MKLDYTALLTHIKSIAKEAGQLIMQVYEASNVQPIYYKTDHSPVTEADLLSHQYISCALTTLTPQIPIVSEEACPSDFATYHTWPYYWLVDPLDGTKEFIAHNDEFVINIALIAHGQPVLGLMYAPVTKTAYFAYQKSPAYKQIAEQCPIEIHARQDNIDDITILTSRHGTINRMNALANALGNAKVVRYGSTLKLCLLAEGKADIYTRFSTMMEWDLAAGQCILEQAGGRVCAIDGSALCYNNRAFKLDNFFAIGCPTYPWQAALARLIKI